MSVVKKGLCSADSCRGVQPRYQMNRWGSRPSPIQAMLGWAHALLKSRTERAAKMISAPIVGRRLEPDRVPQFLSHSTTPPETRAGVVCDLIK